MTRHVVPFDQATRLLFAIPVVRLASRLSSIMQRDVLAPHGLKTAEWRILFNLQTSGDLHLRKLARNSGSDASYVSRLVTRLERIGLIERYADNRDARRTVFTVTARGRQVFDEIWPKAQAVSDDFRSLFDEKQLMQLQTMLDQSILHADRRLEAGAGASDD